MDAQAEVIEASLVRAVCTSAPLLRLTKHSKRWWDDELTDSLRQVRVARKLAGMSGSPTDVAAAQEMTRQFQKLLQLKKTTHWHKYLEDLTDTGIWTAAKYCKPPKGLSTVPELKQPQGGMASTFSEKVEVIHSGLLPDAPYSTREPITVRQHRDWAELTEEEVSQAIRTTRKQRVLMGSKPW